MLQLLQLHILRLINRVRKDEEGATMVEYGIMVGLIACVAIAAVTVLGTQVSTLFSGIASIIGSINPV